ncbi:MULTISPECIES: DUF1003 domain-containing protein [unclassified Novosphingobium]|uniref:DUF1003 domain-containing protein n=1 Tax=unclassified Novosphingobium TaxID=2644732 RepID=UPI00135CDBF1|nr:MULTISPECIES: DUF1003 domain-containing protein [unclassified Novosphingobium]
MTKADIRYLAQSLLGKQPDALDTEEQNVLEDIQNQNPTSQDAADIADQRASFGDRLSDKVAGIGGSWGFIISFGVVLFGWMVLNTDVLGHWHLAFDPYPYIFLNLMLSMLAAVQAPIIMMSQNRQASIDRLAASIDYEVNLRAELEIMRIQDKLDQEVAAQISILLDGQRAMAEQLGQLQVTLAAQSN